MTQEVEHGKSIGRGAGSEEGIQLTEASGLREHSLILKSVSQIEQYSLVKPKVRQGHVLNSQEAAVAAQFAAEGAYLQLSPAFDEISTDTPLRTEAIVRLIEYLQCRGILTQSALEGDKLLLGAGLVLPEAYALSRRIEVVRPKELVAFLLSQRPDDLDEARRTFNQVLTSGCVREVRRGGRLVAVDDDQEFVDLGRQWCSRLGLDVEFQLMDAHAYLEQDSAQYSLIALIRLDPRMTGVSFNQLGKFAERVISRLRPGGQVLVTIGSGNSKVEYQAREDCLRSLKKIFERMNRKTFFHRNVQDKATKDWDLGFHMDIQTLAVLA
jgi:hypothetical protein